MLKKLILFLLFLAGVLVIANALLRWMRRLPGGTQDTEDDDVLFDVTDDTAL